ncbi:MAG TPA: hypothetical protein PKD24_04950 [Pyrinomonadaceae bacterium]|nr:hypothetical protein [Pyrinomonadaceae bacterium]
MAKPNPKKDRDEITVAKSIFDEIVEFSESDPEKEPVAIRRARRGGEARAAKLSPAKRKAIAKKAAESRWGPSDR